MSELNHGGTPRELSIRVAKDTQARSANAYYSYPIIWAVTCLGSGWFLENPRLSWGILIYLVIASAIRTLHLKSLHRYLDDRIDTWMNQVIVCLALHSLFWGGLFAYAIQQDNINFMLFIAFSTAALIPEGTDNFASNPKMARFYIVSMLGPGIAVSLLVTKDWSMALLLAVYLCFIFLLAGRQIQSYWQLLDNEIELSKLSRTDPLTQLDNRRYFNEKLESVCRASTRDNGKVSVAVIDCDHFKRINDDYGHDVGDQCLKHVASQLVDSLRSNDSCARYGGEEFSLILPGLDANEAKVVTERIRLQIESTPINVGQQTIQLTVSIGCASREIQTFDASLPNQLFKQADLALYAAKQNGRNRCVHARYDEQQQTYQLES